MRILLIIFIFIINTSSIYEELPPLKSHFYQDIRKHPINLTSSEKLNITLPQVDSNYFNSILSLYPLQEQQFNQMIALGKKADENVDKLSEDIFVGKNGLSLSEVGFKCQMNEGSVKIMRENSNIKTSSNARNHKQYEDKIYVLVPTRSLLYSLKPDTMLVEVFHFNENSLSLVSQLQIADTTSKASISINHFEDRVYIFTDENIWSINTKTILTDIKKITWQFNTTITKGLDKVISAGEGYFLGIKKMEGVYLFGQNSYKSITRYRDTRLIPQDIFVKLDKIYILDLHTGIYIFSLLPNGQIQSQSFIELKTYSNSEFLFDQSTIFVLYNDPASKIAEIYYNIEKQRGELVRYYKNDDLITSMSVFHTVSHQTQSKEKYLFLLSDEDYIQVYPFNIDPRMIKTLNNGAKLLIHKIRHIFKVNIQDYILISDEQIKYIQLEITKPQIICKTNQIKQGKYRLQIISNVSTCENYNKLLLQHKKIPYEYCQLKQNYAICIRDPERSQLEKIIFYGIVGGFCLLLMGGLMCLIHWRNNKIAILTRLKDQITKFRNRAKKLQPFAEEEQNSKDIDVQLPNISQEDHNKPQNDQNYDI